MHTLLGFSSLLLVILGGSFTLGMLHHVSNWSQRRTLQFLILVMPIVTLGLGIGGLHHFIGRNCFRGTPFWDFLLGVVLPLGMVVVALGALGLGVIRLLLMARVVTRRGVATDAELQTLADTLALQLGATRVRVLLCPSAQPLALTAGLWRPVVLLSTWMVKHLDRRELEAVLAHELEHVARRDYFVIWLATVLRDAFFYLPTSRAAYRLLQKEKELACDDGAVGVTRRPLALASALAKVWHNAVDRPCQLRVGAAQPLVEVGESIQDRIGRLLSAPGGKTHTQHSRVFTLGVSVSSLLALLGVQGVNLIIILAMMGCNPIALLQKLF